MIGLLGVLVASGLVVAALSTQERYGAVYSVAGLHERLAAHPAAWVGRPLRVRALAGACTTQSGTGPCLYWQPELTDPDAPPGAWALPLARGSSPPLLALLRRLPLLGDLAPPPQRPHWGQTRVYSLLLQAGPCFTGDPPPCYEAVLIDAADEW
jgi:hypothetical protein